MTFRDRLPWLPALTLRRILGGIAVVGALYVGAIALIIAFRIDPVAHTLQHQSTVILAVHDQIHERLETIEQAIDDAHRMLLASDRDPKPDVRRLVRPIRARLDSIASMRYAESVRGVPAEMRRFLADAAQAESESGITLLDALALIELHRPDAAFRALQRADASRERTERLLESAQRVALVDMLQRERSLALTATFTERTIVWWLAIGALFAVGVSLYLRRRIDKPLAELEHALTRVASGDLGAAITPRRDDEIGRLGKHFNAMTAVLRLRAEDERRRRENLAERLGHLLEDSDNQIFVIDSEQLRIRQASRGALEHLGYGILQLLQMTALDLVPPADGSALLRMLEELRARGTGHATMETRLRRHDGRSYPATISVQLSSSETPAVFLVVAQDISERREAERLREALRDFSLSRGALLAAGDLERVQQVITAAVAQSLQAERVSLWRIEGKSLRCGDLYEQRRASHGSRPPIALDACRAYLESLKGDRVIAGDALEAPVRVAGQLSGVLRIEHHGKRRAWTADEQNFAASMADFAAIAFENAERRHLQVQLAEAQRIESIGMLAGGIAHDFNNLLTAVMSHVELATLQLPEQHPATDDLHGIQHAAVRAADLTRQLLTFARRQIVAPRVLDLNILTRQMDKMLRRLIGENVELVTLLEPAIGLTRVDPTQYEQVIMNLAVNARDAMPAGGTLTIRTGMAELTEDETRGFIDIAPGQYVMVQVTDTGVGMEESVRLRVFEPFFTTKERGRGTGLGLATVHGIVRQSGGHITIESRIGHGTRVTVYFPLEGTMDDAITAEHRVVATGGHETILVVEDERQIREVLTRALSAQGYRIVAAANGAEGLEAARRHQGRIDLVITDVVMPLLGGRDLARALADERPETAVLFMSGYPEQAIGQDGVIEEGLDFLPKPFTVAELGARVREVLDRSSRWQDQQQASLFATA